MTEKEYKKYPYKQRYPRPDDAKCNWYAFYRENGERKRKSLGTRNERIAEKKFVDLEDCLDKGVLGFSLKPKPIPFKVFCRRFLKEGTYDLAEASVLRHRQNLFGLERDKSNREMYLEKEGHLVKFFRNRDFKSIRIKDVTRYIRHRAKNGAAPNTILKELATLSSMLRFAMTEELIMSNPVLAVKKPKLTLVRPNYTPTDKELIMILKHLHPTATRFFLAFCNSGCRKSELVRCNIGDVNLEEKVLTVIGKGNKKRKIYMNDVLVECIKSELDSRPGAKPNDPLFLNRKGKRYRTLRTPLTTACERAGLPHVSHHSLRHAYATLQYRDGLDIVSLSKLLGHANPTITQNIYVKADEEKLRKAAEGFQIGGAKKEQTGILKVIRR
ncbi:tyrosine-type recombinase/integrase [Acidobacteria bacterium AH-259-D05]|nr:tyrosine-type recombinase/integrase [Acidobacteria bacterium AH-259-D05]